MENFMVALISDCFYSLSPWISYPLVIIGLLFALIVIVAFLGLFFWMCRFFCHVVSGIYGMIRFGY
jgi:hypothetical protein